MNSQLIVCLLKENSSRMRTMNKHLSPVYVNYFVSQFLPSDSTHKLTFSKLSSIHIITQVSKLGSFVPISILDIVFAEESLHEFI